MSRTGFLAVVCVLGLLLPHCRQDRVRRPPSGPHRPSLEEVSEVDYPPPPARIERVDPLAHREDDCVWIDGAWAWQGRRWVWEPGAWVIPPPGCYYAPSESFWQPDGQGPGTLFFRSPAWYPVPSEGAGGAEGALPVCPVPSRCDSAPAGTPGV